MPDDPDAVVDRALWIGAVAFFGVGDAVTTVVGIHWLGIPEGNPVAAGYLPTETLPALLVVVVVLKAVAIGLCFGASRAVSPPLRHFPATVLVSLGAVTTAWNAWAMAGVV